MDISIRNMVCPRCISTVERIFSDAAVSTVEVRLGSVRTEGDVSAAQEAQLRANLSSEGFEWLDDQKAALTEQVKNELITLVQNGNLDEFNENISGWLQKRIGKDYGTISHTFSAVTGTTIEQFVIQQKIEKIKEWLSYGELSLGEMAVNMGYSSVAHLSAQFKKVTGKTPTQFKQSGSHGRRPIDGL